MHTYILTYVYTHIYTYAHIYMDTYVYTYMYVVGSESFRPDIQKPRQMENAVRDI